MIAIIKYLLKGKVCGIFLLYIYYFNIHLLTKLHMMTIIMLDRIINRHF